MCELRQAIAAVAFNVCGIVRFYEKVTQLVLNIAPRTHRLRNLGPQRIRVTPAPPRLKRSRRLVRSSSGQHGYSTTRDILHIHARRQLAEALPHESCPRDRAGAQFVFWRHSPLVSIALRPTRLLTDHEANAHPTTTYSATLSRLHDYRRVVCVRNTRISFHAWKQMARERTDGESRRL